MSITIKPVQSSDLINDGRTKFNENDASVAQGIVALSDQLDTHETEGHPDLYYTQSEVDAKLASTEVDADVVWLTFGYNKDTNKVFLCGVENGVASSPADGSIVSIIVTDTGGNRREIEYNSGVNAVDEEDRISVLAGPDVVPGDAFNPFFGGIIVAVSGTNSYELTALSTGIPGFTGFGNFSITIGIKIPTV